MEFFVDDKETEELFQEILKKMQLLRNGETHHEMKTLGLNYQKSLGATIVNLRDLAKDYHANHLLAHKLWTKGFRESKILATLLEEPEKVSTQQINRWLNEMDSNELLEQACMNLFVHLPNKHNLVKDWMKSDNPIKNVGAVMTMRRMAMNTNEKEEQLYIEFIDLLPQKMNDQYFLNQVKRTLGQFVRKNNAVKKKVVTLVTDLKNKDKDWSEIWDDLKYELDL